MFSDLKRIKDPVHLLKEMYTKVSPTDRFAYISGFLLCLIVNLFVYTNTCFVHDSIRIFDDSTGIANGRILVGPLLEIINRMQIPWVIGLITCFFMGFVVVFIRKIFLINRKLSVLLMAGFIITSETMFVSHAYFSSVYIYVFSLLLAILGVHIADYNKVGSFFSIILLCLSMFCYQAFISTAIALFIVKLILFIINDEKGLKSQFLYTLKYALIVIISAGLYYLVWQLILKICNKSIVDYYAYQGLRGHMPVSRILSNIVYAYEMAIQFLSKADVIMTNPVLSILGGLISIFVFLSLVVYGIKKHRFFTMIVYIAAYILSINIIFLLSGIIISNLTVFSIVVPFIFFVFLCEKVEIKKAALKNSIAWASLIMCLTIIIGQAVCGNALYLKMKTNYDNAWSYATRVVDRLEQIEGFNKDSKLIIISGGKNKVTDYPQNPDIVRATRYVTRFDLLGSPSNRNNSIQYADTLKWFIQQEMDINLDIETNPEKYEDSKAIENMPIFPSVNSIIEDNGTFIIKIS